jgi:glyoxylase-like metal-dependent hydrolase (beta-lactamase superfamily II)
MPDEPLRPPFEESQMQVAPNVFHFPTGPFNWYIVRDAGRLTLVDAGFPGHYAVFAAAVRSLGHTVRDVAGVLLTHAHADHMGFAERVRAESGAPVYAHRDDRAAAMRTLQLPWGGLLSNAWRPFVASVLFRATRRGVFFAPRIRQVSAVEDGDTLDVPGRPRVIHVPGHTPGQVAYHFAGCGVLAAGDAVITQDLMTGRHGPPQLPRRTLNRDDRQARHSLDRLQDVGRVTILPGHGRPWSGEVREAVELAARGSS